MSDVDTGKFVPPPIQRTVVYRIAQHHGRQGPYSVERIETLYSIAAEEADYGEAIKVCRQLNDEVRYAP